MDENWLPVPGHLGYYVYDQGRVRSKLRVDKAAHTLSPRLAGPKGKQYQAVRLAGGKERKVHLLVLEAFVGPRPEGMEGCHNDGDKLNNRLDNLRWDTPGANNRDKRSHGTDHQVRKTHCPRGHEYTPENCYDPTMQVRRCKTCAREKARTQGAPKTPRTHCRKGHEFTPENTRASGGQRKCRTCERARRRTHRTTPPSE